MCNWYMSDSYIFVQLIFEISIECFEQPIIVHIE